MMFLTPLPCFLLIVALSCAHEAKWSERTIDDDFTLKWRIFANNTAIEFNVLARTRGWLAIGLSPDGGMSRGSDIMIGWLDDRDGVALVLDASIGVERQLLGDAQQDVFGFRGEQNATHTSLRWRRALSTCDADGDRAITVRMNYCDDIMYRRVVDRGRR